MITRIAKSRKMPVLYSYYISQFEPETLDLLKNSKPFTIYHRDLQEYELTPDVYAKIKEYNYETIDEREPMPYYVRNHLEPYGYQQDAVEFARTTDNVFINFPQGMGKSFTTMKILLDRKIQKTLVVCGQGNLQEEWIKDATKHNLRDTLNMHIVGEDSGASSAKKLQWLDNVRDTSFHTDLINIEALRNIDIVSRLNAIKYDCIVVDEVQSAKGWKAEQTKGLHELVRTPGQLRIALSGTPVLNDPLEFFSLLKYFNILQDTARSTFERYYGEWSFDFWGHYVCTGYRNLEDLFQLLEPIICYVSKSVLGLPPKVRKRVPLQWTDRPERYDYLQKVHNMSIKRLKKAGFTSKVQVRAEMQYLSSTAKPKIDFVASYPEGTKQLVFSEYTQVLDKYYEELTARGKTVLYYHGKLNMKERLKVLSDWHSGKADILLLSIMTARYGLNLTEACITTFIEPPTSMAILEQAEDRAHRIGQTKSVLSNLLSVSDSDEKDLENIARKQEALDVLNSKLGIV